MGTVDDTEHIVPTDEAKSRPGTLQVVEGLAHVTFGTEDQGSYSIFRVLDLLGLADLHQSLHDLSVGQSCISKNGATRLKGFDDLVRLVASKGESSGSRVDFHCTAQRLLGTRSHAASFQQDEQPEDFHL